MTVTIPLWWVQAGAVAFVLVVMAWGWTLIKFVSFKRWILVKLAERVQR